MLLSRKESHILITILLLLAVSVVYWNASDGAFLLHHDDDDYVTGNDRVKGGLSLENMAWAFTRSHAANWHPLTWISHQADVELYGLNPKGHHRTNLLLHALNTLLLFWILSRMTRGIWRSGFAAALFAVHPLHVESVAWVAERKDLLSTFFMMLTLLAYHRYVRSPDLKRYLLVTFLFALGLLAKPMLVTLPFVLLLLDWWPLKRAGLKRALLEKVPLLFLSMASCVITVMVQKAGGAMQHFPLLERLGNAASSYVHYILKMLWPLNLAAIYPHPEGALPLWQVLFFVFLLAAITYLVVRHGRRYPYLPVGWFWYLGTLVPVIGIVQVGNQAMADRYTYIPLVGLFVGITWGAAELVSLRVRKSNRLLGGLAMVVLVLLVIPARIQVSTWKDSPTLFRHAISVTENNYLAEHDLGMALILKGKHREGLAHIEKAVQIKPNFGVAYVNLAYIYFALGDLDKTRACIRLSRENGWEPDATFLQKLEEKD